MLHLNVTLKLLLCYIHCIFITESNENMQFLQKRKQAN